MDKQATAALPQLENMLKKTGHQFTLNDAAAFTGLAVHQAKEALNQLMDKYRCRLKLTENGDLIYDFGESLQRRGEKTLKERFEEAGRWLWKAFVAFYKVWITVTLVFYFVVFVLILVAFIIAAMSGDKSGKRSSSKNGGAMISGLFRALFTWNSFQRHTRWRTDSHGYRYREFTPKKSVLSDKEDKKNFVASVYDFVFGPPRVKPGELANQQELAAFVRREKGLLVTAEVIGLTGLPPKAAEELFAESLIRFNGDFEITENGMLYANYPDLLRSKNQALESEVVWFWDEYEPPYELNANKAWDNWKVIGMNTFNLLFSIYFLGMGDQEPLFFWILGVVPFLFSVIFFSVPAIRYFRVKAQEQLRLENNERKRLMRVIFQHYARQLAPEEIVELANQQRNQEELMDFRRVQPVLETLLHDLEAEGLVNDEGKFVYTFPKLQRELGGIKSLRENFRPDTDLGNIEHEID